MEVLRLCCKHIDECGKLCYRVEGQKTQEGKPC